MEQGYRPKLRAVDAVPIEWKGKGYVVLKDPLGLTGKELFLPIESGFLLNLLNGQNTVLDLKAEYIRKTGYMILGDQVEQLLSVLDNNLMLDNERFHQAVRTMEEEFRLSPLRKPFHAGLGYPDDPRELKALIDSFYLHEKGPGKLPDAGNGLPAVALAAPHIDVRAGGPTFAWAYHALSQGPPPDRFVILGTGHQMRENLFCLTAKDFETPLGSVKTDRIFLDHLTAGDSTDYFKEELLHRSEHTIEFQIIFLQHLYGEKAAFTIVPVLCSLDPEIFFAPEFEEKKSIFREFSGRLSKTLKEMPGRTCLIASVDLDHVGPRYGDNFRPSHSTVQESLDGDRDFLTHAAGLRDSSFLETVRRINHQKRICGFPPLYTLLKVLSGSRGTLLRLDHAVVDRADSFVTFAAMVFH